MTWGVIVRFLPQLTLAFGKVLKLIVYKYLQFYWCQKYPCDLSLFLQNSLTHEFDPRFIMQK